MFFGLLFIIELYFYPKTFKIYKKKKPKFKNG